MGFVKLDRDTWDFVISRDLRVGPPNSGKTISLLTNERPMVIISYPGEKGVTSLPVDEPGITSFIWKEDDMTKNKPGTIIKEVEALTWDILAGKHGEVKSFAGDGLHKLYSHYWLREFNSIFSAKSDLIGRTKKDGTTITEEDFRLQAYGNENYGASREFMSYVTRVYESTIPHVSFTCWEGVELDAPELKSQSGKHIFPDFPGKLAKRIMGEFAVVLYSHLIYTDTPKGAIIKANWQLRPGGKVWGAGIKIPPHIAKNIPKEIEQDWQVLYPYLQGKKKYQGPTTQIPTQAVKQ